MGSRAGGKTVADVRGGGADVDVDLHLDSDREEERGGEEDGERSREG